MFSPEKFTNEENIIISWQWRYNNLDCRILELAKTMDSENLEKLRQGFPHHVSALKRFHGEAGWFGSIEARLRKIEQGESYELQARIRRSNNENQKINV